MNERVRQEAVEAVRDWIEAGNGSLIEDRMDRWRVAKSVRNELLPALREQLEAEVRERLENLHQDLVIEAGAEAEKVEDDPNAEDTPEFAASEAYIDAASRAANLARTFGTTEEEGHDLQALRNAVQEEETRLRGLIPAAEKSGRKRVARSLEITADRLANLLNEGGAA